MAGPKVKSEKERDRRRWITGPKAKSEKGDVAGGGQRARDEVSGKGTHHCKCQAYAANGGIEKTTAADAMCCG